MRGTWQKRDPKYLRKTRYFAIHPKTSSCKAFLYLGDPPAVSWSAPIPFQTLSHRSSVFWSNSPLRQAARLSANVYEYLYSIHRLQDYKVPKNNGIEINETQINAIIPSSCIPNTRPTLYCVRWRSGNRRRLAASNLLDRSWKRKSFRTIIVLYIYICTGHYTLCYRVIVLYFMICYILIYYTIVQLYGVVWKIYSVFAVKSIPHIAYIFWRDFDRIISNLIFERSILVSYLYNVPATISIVFVYRPCK